MKQQQIEKQISEAQLTLDYQLIKSPVDGLVFDLQAEAPGYVVNTNLPILKIVPVDDLVARIFVSNKDIAFIKPKQSVKIRVDAYHTMNMVNQMAKQYLLVLMSWSQMKDIIFIDFH